MPWHLTTTEFASDIQRVLRDGGIYAQNIIDQPPLGFLRAEVATLRDVFAHVAVIGSAGRFDGSDGGNTIVVASDRPLPLERIAELNAGRGDDDVVVGDPAALDDFVDGAPVLTDEHAPGRPAADLTGLRSMATFVAASWTPRNSAVRSSIELLAPDVDVAVEPGDEHLAEARRRTPTR